MESKGPFPTKTRPGLKKNLCSTPACFHFLWIPPPDDKWCLVLLTHTHTKSLFLPLFLLLLLLWNSVSWGVTLLSCCSALWMKSAGRSKKKRSSPPRNSTETRRRRKGAGLFLSPRRCKPCSLRPHLPSLIHPPTSPVWALHLFWLVSQVRGILWPYAVFSADHSCRAIREPVYSFDWIAALLCISLSLCLSLYNPPPFPPCLSLPPSHSISV